MGPLVGRQATWLQTQCLGLVYLAADFQCDRRRSGHLRKIDTHLRGFAGDHRDRRPACAVERRDEVADRLVLLDRLGEFDGGNRIGRADDQRERDGRSGRGALGVGHLQGQGLRLHLGRLARKDAGDGIELDAVRQRAGGEGPDIGRHATARNQRLRVV